MMKINDKISLLSLLLCCFACIGRVEAQNIATDDSCIDDSCEWTDDYCWNWDECYWDDCCESPSRVYIGPVYYFRKARFNNNTGDIVAPNNVALPEPLILANFKNRDAKGTLWGVNGGYEYKELCCLYFRADFTWSEGHLKGCPRHSLQEWILDGRLGYTWGECTPCGWSITPYAGIGYLWDDRNFEVKVAPPFATSDSSFIDFRARYRAWFVPVGVYAEVEIMCDFTAGIDVTWRPMFDCRVKTDGSIDGASQGTHDIDINEGNLSDRYSWRVEVPLRWTISADWGFELAVQPFWEYYSFGKVKGQYEFKDETKKDLNTVFGIPSFHEDAWGAKFLIGFRF